MDDSGTKKCTKCGEVKPLSEFHNMKTEKGEPGKRPECKMCSQKQRLLYREKNRKLLSEKQKIYYQAHLPEHAEYRKRYYETHTEKKRADARRWGAENRERKNKRQSEYLKTEAGRLSNARHEFKRRELKFDPLNRKFPGTDFHHLCINGDKSVGVFIPKELHGSIRHKRTGGKGLEQMNRLAMSWVVTQAVTIALIISRKMFRCRQSTLKLSFE